MGDQMNNGKDDQRGTMIAGLAVIGLVVVGVGSISAAFFSLVGYSDFVGGGIFALAAALAFGQLLGGLLRN